MNTNINLHLGDCLEVMKNISDKSVDMILCDLPYGTTRNKWDIVIDFNLLWKQYERVIKDNGAIVLFSQMPFTVDLVSSNRKLFRYEWIWVKEQGTGFLNAKRMPLKIHENILVFYKKLPTYNPQGLIKLDKPIFEKERQKTSSNYRNFSKDNYRYFTNYPIDILKYKRDGNRLHPTQKPVTLLEYLVKTYTNECEIVLDNCMGSGSTGVACVNANRNFIGIEKEKKYFDIAKQRIEEAAKNNSTFLT